MRAVRNPGVLRLAAFWFGAGLLAVCACAEEPAARVMAGELIVKFQDSSEAGMLVRNAMSGQPLANQSLTDLVRRLASDLGTPLRLAHLSSGRELVLSVDREQLAQRLAEQISRDPDVSTVVRAATAPGILPPAQLTLVVELRPGSNTRRELLKPTETGPDLATLISRLTAGFAPPLTGELNAGGQLLLSANIEALTARLLTRVQRLDDVEYAQLSHLARPFAPVTD